MEQKYDYVKGYCTKFKVNGLWPVLTARSGSAERYRHESMACSQYGSEGCSKEACRVLSGCPEYVDPDQEWLLKDRLS